VSGTFLRCSFAKNCWLNIGVHAPTWLKPNRADSTYQKKLGSAVCYGYNYFDDLVYMERNAWLFSGEDPSSRLVLTVVQERIRFRYPLSEEFTILKYEIMAS
jgi:hypothetical protein